MTPITYRVGDAVYPVESGPQIIVHICNDLGRWGKGFVQALSKRSKQPETAYKAWAKEDSFGLGQVQFVRIDDETEVANVVGQHKVRRADDEPGAVPPVRYEAIAQGLKTVAEHALVRSATVHMPRIGCGLAGGKWERVEPIILRELSARGIAVFVCDLPTE